MAEVLKSYKMPKSVLAFHLVRIGLVFLIGVLPTWFLSHDFKLTGTIALLLGLLGVIVFFILYLEYYYFSIAVESDRFTVRSGIIIKNIKTIAFNSIQTIDVTYDPIIWVFNLVVLRIWTASPEQLNISGGDSASRPVLAFYMSKAEAEAIKDLVARR